MEKDEIIIRYAIIHILDSTIGTPVLSDCLVELSPDLNDFIRNHIFKVQINDDAKQCKFQEDSFVSQCLNQFEEQNLIAWSKQIASHLYAIMNTNIAITPADIFFVTYQIKSELYLAILKMNYKQCYIHCTDIGEHGSSNEIIKQHATLPSDTSKLGEAVLIRLEDKALHLVEKKYEINGTKINYLSELFLQCYTNLSPKTKLNLVEKAVNQIHKKYYEEDFDKKMEVKSILHNEYMEQGAINIETISEKIFPENEEIKAEFTEKLVKYQIQKEEVKPINKATTKKLEKQYLTTDTGIEINIPMEQYNEKKNIDFITNADGTISVLIKNIGHIRSK